MGFSLQCVFAKKGMYCRESAVVLVTHQLQYLEQADLIVVLKQGEIQVQILFKLF
jgi:ABC-type transport system involved in cytochrome bd biosynthesis fused ATPase/permease subunit